MHEYANQALPYNSTWLPSINEHIDIFLLSTRCFIFKQRWFSSSPPPLPPPLLLLRWIFSCVLVDSWWNVSSCSSSFPSSIRIPPTGPSNSNRNERQFRGGPRQVDPQLSASFSLKYFHEIGNQRTHIRNEDAALTSLPTTIATGTPITITTALVNYKHDQYFVLIK